MSDARATGRLGPHEAALLRAGARAAVTVAVVALHLRGTVDAGRPGTLRRSGTAADATVFRHPLEKAVRTALYRPAGPRELLERAVVRRALARMRADLVAAGQLRPLPPRRSRAVRRLLAELRERHPLPAAPDGPLAEEETLYAVALYGERALTVLLPRFSRQAGLTGRGALADEGLFPFGRGSGVRRFAGGEDLFDWVDDDRDGGGTSDGAGHGGSHAHDGGHHGGGHHHGGHDHGGGFGCGGGGGGFD
ncbi:TIGR04222 domain-containing membrane protein [Streptomyces sp. Ru71]|uniref:TIGR04222 domain-containing membrane protein n=1 Tax=Streptomyces sp. Ru71 TaxID=2080746 RepID=UPI000CDD4C80|nr:TIGR04222 domain-containing membrane protein [Streptomyces sp. Ru71]POX44940.1 TIGR04222 domain-containing membrane protein [Streptomyces sp. Ru71]